jgi:hypothetical protein
LESPRCPDECHGSDAKGSVQGSFAVEPVGSGYCYLFL